MNKELQYSQPFSLRRGKKERGSENGSFHPLLQKGLVGGFILLLAVFTLQAQARTHKKTATKTPALTEALALYNSQKYSEAETVYAAILKKKPADGVTNFGYANCLIKEDKKELAIAPLQIAVNKKITEAYPLLVDIYWELYYFDEAASTIEEYLTNARIDSVNAQKYRALLPKAMLGAQLIRRVEEITIVDSLQVDKKNFFTHYPIGKDLGTVFLSQVVKKNAQPSDAMAYRSQRGDRILFADSVHGKSQLFSAFQMLDTWSDPTPLSATVNDSGTSFNCPFMLPDGVTLYYTAKGENSLGGYDMFVTRFNSERNDYFPPQNVGMPFNSPYNDYFMVIDEMDNIGWFATDRFQPAGKVMIYTYIPNAEPKIIQSDDKDYIRRAAQLKTYKTGKKPVLSIITNHDSSTSETSGFQFVINDAFTYTSISQFKSKEALSYYQTGDSLEREQKSIQQQLEQKRAEYVSAGADSEKSRLRSEILALEQRSNALINKPQRYYKMARQAEIETVQGK